MAAKSFNERMAQERRARLQAEQLLALRSEELYSANRKLALHADALSSQVIEQRHENELLKGKTTKTEAELEVATERAMIAQRRLWDAFTASDDGFAIFDRDWRLVAGNPAFFQPFDGIAEVSEGATYEALLRIAVEEGVIDLQGEDPDDWVDRMIARWEMTPIPRVDIKLWNGAYIRLTDKQTPQGDFVSLGVDITPNIRRERLLRNARDKAMAASRAKSNFLANMSHEIRTPMNGVVSMAELLRETDLDEDQRLYADTIRNSGEALLVIINDVLDFSKIEAGKLELHEEPFDLNATVREIFRLLQPTIASKDLELALDYDIFLPPTIIGDRGRIRQILTNLIGNAVKFTETGGVTVRVLASQSPEAAQPEDLNISIVVEDTGVGIEEEKQAHVFGEFNQVEDERNRRHDGTGLGLAITQKLVKLMGGTMWLESEVGQGSAFGFSLALKRDLASDGAPVAGLPVAQARVLVIGRGGNLEDEVMDALTRLHAEVTMVRRIPSARDLDDTQAVVICDGSVSADDVAAAMDAAGFCGARLACLTDDAGNDSFTSWSITDGLATLRGLILVSQVQAAQTTPDASEPPLPEAPQPETPAQTLPRLLAAEDNKTNQLVFKTMLKGLDLAMEMTSDGAELLAAYKRETPDLVMTDISMPEMDGLEAARAIRAYEAEQGLPRVTIIAMTAHAMDGDKERILEAGLDDYVTKPLKKAVILEKVMQGLAPLQAQAS